MSKVVSITEVAEAGLSRFGAPVYTVRTTRGTKFHTEPDNSIAYEVARYLRPGDKIEIDLDVYGRITDFHFVA